MSDLDEKILKAALQVGYLQSEVDRLEGYRIGSGPYMEALQRVTSARSRLERLQRDREAEELLR